MKDFINELFIKWHCYWMQKSSSLEGRLAHMNAFYFHLKSRSKKQIQRMENKRGLV